VTADQPGRAIRWPLLAGAFFALTAVMAGAFGAHALRATLAPRSLEVFQTASTYQMYHALALVMIAGLSASGLRLNRKWLTSSAVFITLGVVLFCGSLYGLTLTQLAWLGPVTPLGGLCFMLGWLSLLVAGFGSHK